MSVTAADARRIVAATIEPDDCRTVGRTFRHATYFVVEIGVPGLLEIGGSVACVDIETGALEWRPEIDVALEG